MSHTNTVFSQILKLVPRHVFKKLEFAHHTGRALRANTRFDQFTALALAQLGGQQSLRDIERNLKTQNSSLYHTGSKPITRSTLARINEKRDYRLYESLFYQLLSRCQGMGGKHGFRFKNPLYSLDASLIDLSIKVFPWSDINGADKGAVKLHVGLNHQGNIPEFVDLTDGRVPDIQAARRMDFPRGSIIVMDKGYTAIDYYKQLNDRGNFFVTRLKRDIKYRVIHRENCSQHSGVMSDHIIELTGEKAVRIGAPLLRRVGYRDRETGKFYEFLTNHFSLSPKTIADIYKARWQVELFFKHIKQNLKIKTFIGKSKNAMMTQIWVAMCVHLILVYLKYANKIKVGIQQIMRMLKINLFCKISLMCLFEEPPPDKSDCQFNQVEMLL